MADDDFDVQAFARGINELLILSTLREREKHGYQIAVDVEEESNGLFKFRHGTLYPILHRLEAEGYLRGTWSRADGRRRKVYTLTRDGERYLAGESRRVDRVLQSLMSMVRGPDEVTT